MSLDKLLSSVASVAKRRPLTVIPMLLFAVMIGGDVAPVVGLSDPVEHDWWLYAITGGVAITAMLKDSFDRWTRARYDRETTADTTELQDVRLAGE